MAPALTLHAPYEAPLTNMDSAPLASSDLLGVESALARLYDEFAPGIYRFCLGMLGKREDAEDAVQGLWLKLARDPEPWLAALEPRAYLWAMARNLVKSRLRRRALEWLWTPALDPETADLLIAQDHNGLDAATRRDLWRAVSRLRPRLREVVLLVGIEGHTLEEAASLLDIPRGTAASRYHAATSKLRQWLSASPARPQEIPE